MPAQQNHPVFEAPKDINVKIWRYMDFTKFVSLLDTRALYFSRADLLGDPYEGSTPHLNKANWRTVYKGIVPDEVLEGSTSKNRELNMWMREWTFINCWHINESESAAMWKLYAQTNEAVAIQSTYSLLNTSLPSNSYVGLVKYIDYNKEWMPENNSMYPFMHKRNSFVHERELRALIYDPPIKTLKDGQSGYDRKPNPENGRLVPVDIGSLIQNIYVAPTCPEWFSSLVNSVIAKYELSVAVAPSIIDQPPTY